MNIDLQELRRQYSRGKRFKYLYFWGHAQKQSSSMITKSCLSQWYYSGFVIDNIYYPTAEHYMMAEKARLFNDQQKVLEILKANNPKLAKSLGSCIFTKSGISRFFIIH